MEQLRSTSPTRQARIVGLSYLIVIAGGLFAEGYARSSLIVLDDAAATAREIAASESLWRWGLAVHLLYLAPSIVVNVVLFGLFKPVQPILARLAIAFGLISVTIEAMSLLQLYVPIAMIQDGSTLGSLDAGQKQSLIYLAVLLFSAGFAFALLFFAGFCVVIGTMIVRSQLVPRVIGILMIAAGACYFINSLAFILSPSLSDRIFPAILLPCLIGELSLALWLLVNGVHGQDRRQDVIPARSDASADVRSS